MYLKYGSYSHDAGEVTLTVSREATTSTGGVRDRLRIRYDIAGRLQISDQGSESANQVAMTTAINVLKAAYAVGGKDIGLYQDDDTATSHVLLSAATIGGTRVVKPPSFPEGRGAEYSTFRNYVLAVEAEQVLNDGAALSGVETIAWAGGGQRFVYLQTLTGPSQKQLVNEQTTFKATQTGNASGNGQYPFPSPPLWPADEHIEKRKMNRTPPASRMDREFKISWAYEFESNAPLLGNPTEWW